MKTRNSRSSHGLERQVHPGEKRFMAIRNSITRLFARWKLAVVLSALLTLSALPAVTARADDFYYDGKHYFFFIDDVPDIDQKRAFSRDGAVKGLPNDGNMYCAPTAALNWMAYIANRGYPNVGPGPGNWEVSPPQYLNEYNYITGNLFIMGLLMQTHAINGTGAGKAIEGTAQWLDTAAPDNFIVVGVFAHEDWSPRTRDASMMTIFGGLVNVGMGWYTNAGQPKAHVRKGGHVVTLVHANNVDGDDTYGTISLNDPASGADNIKTTQSPFRKESNAFHSETQYFCGEDDNGFPANCYQRTQDRLTYTGSGYMDGFLAIIPKYGLGYSLSEILLYHPFHLSNRALPVVSRFETTGARNVLDLALNPTRIQHPYLIENSDVVWKLDVLTGQSTEFARVKNPLRLVYGGTDESLYVLRPRQLDCFNRAGQRTRNLGLQGPLDAIAYDEKNKRLAGLSREAGRIYLFDLSLRRMGSMPLPDGVLGDTGRLTLSINPATGELWTLFDGARYINRFELGETDVTRLQRMTLPEEIVQAHGLYVDEKGNAFITGDGSIFPLDENGQIKRSSPFFGLQAGDGFQLARPFTNFDPATMTGPSFYNVLPEDADRFVGN